MNLVATLWRLIALCLLSALALQLYFLLRIALMTGVDPSSTCFERSEIWRLSVAQLGGTQDARKGLDWRQSWVDYGRISPQLGRAVIASEDGSFIEHFGVEWDALQSAWDRNQKAQERAAKANERLAGASRQGQ